MTQRRARARPIGLLLAATATALVCAAPAQAQPPGGRRLADPASAGAPVGIAASFPTHCGVGSLVAGHEGNVWFTCEIETNYGYGSRVKVGRVTPAGQVTEFGGPFPKNLQPGGIVAAANGDLWFPISSLYILLPGKRRPPELARVTPSGEVTTYRPGLGAKYDIQELVASPNGYLWFTAATSEESKNPSLWQISPEGEITRLPIDLGAAAYTVLDVGPEGNLWFTKEPASGSAKTAIVRLAPGGELTEFGATIPGFSPSTPGFAVDGTGWFFRGGPATGVARITAAGEITDTGAKLETGGGIVGGSTFGSDGNLWFSFQSGTLGQSAIERVTPTGTVTVFRDCLRYSQPYFGPASLLTGADGDIWFTSVASRELPGITDPPSIGRITPSGEITQIYAGVKQEARSILAGPDGAIWFSAGADEIQQIAPINGPINTFRVAPLRRVAASGAATARVVVPGPGEIDLKPLALLLRHHKRVPLPSATITASSTACGTTGLRVKPVGAANRKFRKRRDVVEEVAVTYTPSGGSSYTETAKLDFHPPRPHRRHSGSS